MADYYSILKKTIDGLPSNTPEIRQAVYRKARTAIETQLRGMSPVPSEQAITTQLKLLEDSIMVVDAEFAPPPMAEPESVVQAPVHGANTAIPPAQQPEAEQPAQSAPVHNVVPETAPVAAAEHVMPKAVPDAPSVMVEAPPTVNSVPGPEADPIQAVPEIDDSAPSFAEPEKKSRGWIARILTLFVILGLLGGGGYAIWTNKEALQPLLASFISGESDESAKVKEEEKPLSEAEKAIDEDTSAQVKKEAVKLGENGEDTAVTELEEETVRIIESEPERKPLEEILANEDEASGNSEAPAIDPVEDITEPETADVEDSQVSEATPDEQTQTLPIGEVAYLYEEGSAGAGASRTNAAITWTINRESIADGLQPESVIVGTMEVPERNLSVDIEIKRNVDDAVSASHLIEMRFDIPDGFTGGGIDNIARFVMKSTEEARGEPLVAVPVKVSDGFFLIALDNLRQAVSVNSQLLTESGWIDIPISYSTGKRALITLEKGGTGDQVFRDAFRDWENR